MNRVELKKRAKDFAFKNIGDIWKPSLVITLISFLITLFFSLIGIDEKSKYGIYIFLMIDVLLIPLSIGYINYLINLVNGKKLEIKDALLSKYSIFGLIITVNLAVGIFTSLWTLLFIIPGIIYAYKMSMVHYILADTVDEYTSYKDVINKSKELMDGYKLDYFIFELSFIGWELLVIITLGIAAIWVVPYINIANTMYYQELKKIKDKN